MVLNVTGYTVFSSKRRLDPDEDSPVRQSASVRLLAVDPHELIIWGLRTVLTQQPWVERCLQATDLAQAGVLAARYSPHVIMVDGTLADDDGMRTLQSASPSSRLLVMTERQAVPATSAADPARVRVRQQVVGHRGDRRRRPARGPRARPRAARASGRHTPTDPARRAGALTHRARRDQRPDRGRSAALAQHRQAAREQRVPQARRAQPHGGRPPGAVPRVDCLTHSGYSGSPVVINRAPTKLRMSHPRGRESAQQVGGARRALNPSRNRGRRARRPGGEELHEACGTGSSGRCGRRLRHRRRGLRR